MVNGFHLTLMIGPVVPVPVSQEVLDALTSRERDHEQRQRERLPARVHAQQSFAATNPFPARGRRIRFRSCGW